MGPEGPRGETGTTGATGPQGDQGPIGLPGILFKGAWSPLITYEPGDLVNHNGRAFLCSVDPCGDLDEEASFFSESFIAPNLYSSKVTDLYGAFRIEDGRAVHHSGLPASHISTRNIDYRDFDWIYEVDFTTMESGPNDILFVGIGTGAPSNFYYQPKNSLYFLIHRGPNFCCKVDVAGHTDNNTRTINHYMGEFSDIVGSIDTARIIKSGKQLVFQIQRASQVLSYTISDYTTNANYISGNLFFGNLIDEYAWGEVRIKKPDGTIPSHTWILIR